MRCHEARNLLGPYLDSELDAKTSLDIGQHLQSCADCARVFDAETKFEARISTAVRPGPISSALWAKVEAKLAAPSWWDSIRSLQTPGRLGLTTALAAMVVLLALAFWPGTHVPDLARAVGQDHQEFLQGKFGPEFSGSLPDSVARRLDTRLDPAAFTQLPSAAGFQASGSRLCFLRGVPAAWTLGHYANSLVSIIVLKQSELDHFPQIRERLQSGDPVVCSRTGRYQFAARIVGDHVVSSSLGGQVLPCLDFGFLKRRVNYAAMRF
jgi:anti-sigma factor RsiW